MAILALALNTGLGVAQPYQGTVFITPDLITSADRSALSGITYAGRGERTIFDYRAFAWITVNCYLFEAEYPHGTIEWQVNPEFGSVDAARAEVDTYAPALGRLPAILLSRAAKVHVNAGAPQHPDGVRWVHPRRVFGGNFFDQSFTIHTGRGEEYLRGGFLEEVLFHEGAHVSLQNHQDAPGWLAAQQADGGFISTYARDNPAREDVAESVLPYFAVRYRPDRLSAGQREAIDEAIPNRLRYLDEQALDWSPYVMPAKGNRAPQPVGSIPAQTLTVGGASVTVDHQRYFTDPDGDPLWYDVSLDRWDVVAYQLASMLTFEPLAAGTATVTVHVGDPGGLTAEQTFTVTVVTAPDSEADRAVLEALYDATDGANWTDSTNWKTSAPLGEWYGVTTDVDGRVTQLSLSYNRLAGSIPAELGELERLEDLGLAGNDLTGPIPTWLGSLARLRRLSLAGNELTGPIPGALRSLVNLERLWLGYNPLDPGPIPAWLENFRRLDSLSLTSAARTGPVPAWLGKLTSLSGLFLSWNDLDGPIPIELGDLVNLRFLWLDGNDVTGPIPVELRRLGNLQTLDLGDNDLIGPVPAWLSNLTNLRSLRLGGNELTGPIPSELGSLENLNDLRLSGNELIGPIPAELGRLSNLRSLYLERNELIGPVPNWLGDLIGLENLGLGRNELTGPIPSALGRLANLESLYLDENALSGSIPAELGSLSNLERLDLSHNWALSGPLPSGLRESSSLEFLDIFVTRACAPAAWRDWLETIDDFYGLRCGPTTDVTIDVAVLYTPLAREAAGGRDAIEAEIDLMIAETNEAYEASGVRQRLALVARSEVQYTETFGGLDLWRLSRPSDGHLDEAHGLRDETGADVVHLIVGEPFYSVCGIANLPGPFGITLRDCGGVTFAHELGHNMGLRHDRFRVDLSEGRTYPHPAYGYANQRMFEAGAPQSSRWVTIMAYRVQCGLADARCSELLRFSNPRQRLNGDPLGIPFGTGSGVTGPADASAVLNTTGPAVAAWRDRPPGGANRPPVALGTLADRRLPSVGSEQTVDVSRAFVDPDGDALTYAASSAVPWVVRAHATGARVLLTAVGEGAATIRVTATDPDGLSVSRSFSATVGSAASEADDAAGMGRRFTDDPIVRGVTPIKTVHFMELRTRIEVLRRELGLAPFVWTDPVLTAGVTPVKAAHLVELRGALEAAYAAAGRAMPQWTDAAPVAGTTPIRGAHVMELRAAVLARE